MKNLKYDDSGLIPAVIQDAVTRQVLMLGYMNERTLEITIQTNKVTFYSRSRNEIWQKGATSGNYLEFVSCSADCDNDALLILARPAGPTCHTGTTSCFGNGEKDELSTLRKLIATIDQRFTEPSEGSYIQSLIQKGIPKMAQKVGEEGVELVIEAMRDEPELFVNEAADLFFHYLVLLKAKKQEFGNILNALEKRMK